MKFPLRVTEVSVDCLEHASYYIILSSLEGEKKRVDKALETTGFVTLRSLPHLSIA